MITLLLILCLSTPVFAQPVSLLRDPGPTGECVKHPLHGWCMYVVSADTKDGEWHRIPHPQEGFNKGRVSVGVRGDLDSNPCALKEVTTVHYQWIGPHLSFDRAYKFAEFQEIYWQFDARLIQYVGPPRCPGFPSAYVTADTGVLWPDGSWYLLGTLIYNAPDAWSPPTDQPLYWTNGTNMKLVMSEVQLEPGKWQFVRLPLIELYKKYFFPPQGFSWSDAVVHMAEVYPSIRGALKLEVETRNHDVVGVPR